MPAKHRARTINVVTLKGDYTMWKYVSRTLCVVCVSLAIGGCATSGDWQTESAGSDFTNGTTVLGELILTATREQVLANQGLMNGAQQKFITAGYSDEQIVDNAVVTVFSYCYGHNSGVPLCSHHGHFVAFVPMELRGKLTFDGDEAEDTGDLVEVELTRIADGNIVGKVMSVYRKSGNWEPCRQARLGDRPVNDALMGLSGVGPARALWIECEGIEDDGWIRMRVPAAPLNNGPPVSQWFKVPD